MRMLGLLTAILIALTSSDAFAQSLSPHYLSIPSSGFTPQDAGKTNVIESYDGNTSGTLRMFAKSYYMFAPVNLPHGATVTSMRCGGQSPKQKNQRIIFILRRNEPQQANVDMASIMTIFDETQFQFRDTTSITSPVVDNETFNYYIVASINRRTPPQSRVWGSARAAPSASAGSVTLSISEI
jgi:hypothetical protein